MVLTAAHLAAEHLTAAHLKRAVNERVGIAGLKDFKSSFSTGNLLEALLSPTMQKRRKHVKKIHKLSLDCAQGAPGKGKDKWFKRPVLLSNGNTMQKSLSWDEDVFVTNPHNVDSVNTRRIRCLSSVGSSRSLQVPLLPKSMSRSDEHLNRSSESPSESSNLGVINHNDSNEKSKSLLVPLFDKRLSRSDDCLSRIERPLTASDVSQDLKVPRIERQHSDETLRSGNSKTARPKSTHLVLPTLGRQRSKSMETVHVGANKQDEIQRPRARTTSTTDARPSEISTPRHPRPSLSPRSGKVKFITGPRKSSSFGETTEKHIKAVTEKKESKGSRMLRRSSSSPTLLDIGPEVEHLLMEDDQTRLQRMRVAVNALRLMDDAKNCRYIRNVEILQQNQPTNTERIADMKPPSDDQLPTIIQNNSNIHKFAKQSSGDETENEGSFVLELEETEPASLIGSGDDTSAEEILAQSRDNAAENGPIRKLDESLSSSNSSTLAEMFEEIKNTRYLRKPGTSRRSSEGHEDDCDKEDEFDVCMTSHGYNTPLIIVGHTSVVLMDGNILDT
ncbi:hypothetical protein QZH41_002342 [Actinostola sp. cb2023]|nr:hypothetical protein QZH41_002342 [Actinostola sp. cb2023]